MVDHGTVNKRKKHLFQICRLAVKIELFRVLSTTRQRSVFCLMSIGIAYHVLFGLTGPMEKTIGDTMTAHRNYFRNLNALKRNPTVCVWSVYDGTRKSNGAVKASKGKKVGECHDRMVIVDAVLCVSASGVRYVQAHGQKQVCAWINGAGLGDVPTPSGRMYKLAFNPFISDRFVAIDNNGRISMEMGHGHHVSAVVLTTNGAYVIL